MKRENLRVAAYTLGCKVNQYETEAVIRLFAERGYQIVRFEEQADIYLINTCSVTAESDRKNRQIIRRAVKRNPEAVIAVMGCYSQAAPQEAAILGVDILIGTQNRASLLSLVEARLRERTRCATEILPMIQVKNEIFKERSLPFEPLSIRRMDGHTRAFVKIQDGCTQFCTYCIIPYTRGTVRSRPIDEIRREAEQLAAHGYREIVLCGIHLSSYGKDLADRPRLSDAVHTVAAVNGIVRVRLGSMEPMYLTEEVIQELAGIESFCRQFHISLQSGSADVLRRMNRRYTPEEYADIAALLRRYMPDCAITTDVMVGFPGETEGEFEESFHFAEQIAFSRIHVFPFSRRKGTAAWSMAGQVPADVKKERAARMHGLALALERRFMESLLGKREEMLVETSRENGMCCGYGGNYVKILLRDSEKILPGMLIPVIIDEVFGDYCIGYDARTQ